MWNWIVPVLNDLKKIISHEIWYLKKIFLAASFNNTGTEGTLYVPTFTNNFSNRSMSEGGCVQPASCKSKSPKQNKQRHPMCPIIINHSRVLSKKTSNLSIISIYTATDCRKFCLGETDNLRNNHYFLHLLYTNEN